MYINNKLTTYIISIILKMIYHITLGLYLYCNSLKWYIKKIKILNTKWIINIYMTSNWNILKISHILFYQIFLIFYQSNLIWGNINYIFLNIKRIHKLSSSNSCEGSCGSRPQSYRWIYNYFWKTNYDKLFMKVLLCTIHFHVSVNFMSLSNALILKYYLYIFKTICHKKWVLHYSIMWIFQILIS